jgi:hypothetical protein
MHLKAEREDEERHEQRAAQEWHRRPCLGGGRRGEAPFGEHEHHHGGEQHHGGHDKRHARVHATQRKAKVRRKRRSDGGAAQDQRGKPWNCGHGRMLREERPRRRAQRRRSDGPERDGREQQPGARARVRQRDEREA